MDRLGLLVFVASLVLPWACATWSLLTLPTIHVSLKPRPATGHQHKEATLSDDLNLYPEDGPGLDLMAALIEEAGGDPGITIPLLDAMTIAAIDGAKAKIEGDQQGAAIHFGRVAGLLEALQVLGQPTPIERPSEALLAAEWALTKPDEYAEAMGASIERLLSDADADDLADEAELRDEA